MTMTKSRGQVLIYQLTILVLLLFKLGFSANVDSWEYYVNTDKVHCMAIENDTIWAGTEGGLFKFNIKTEEMIQYTKENSELPKTCITAIFIDTSGNKWIGTDQAGIAMFDGKNWTVYNNLIQNVSLRWITGIVVTKTGEVWVGLDNGFAMYDGVSWKQLLVCPDDQNQYVFNVKGMVVDNDDKVWVATGDGLLCFSGGQYTLFTKDSSDIPVDNVLAITIDAQNNVWICAHGIIAKYSQTNKQWSQLEGMMSCFAYVSLNIDNDNVLWIGGTDGLQSYDGTTFNTFPEYNAQLTYNRIHAIVTDKTNYTWVASDVASITRIDSSQWTDYSTKTTDIVSNSVQAIAIDRNDTKWIATNYGLSRYDGSNWKSYTVETSPGMPIDVIRSIAVDSTNAIWIGTYKGAGKLSGDDKWTIYDSSNSPIQPREISVISCSPEGDMWIGGRNGGLTHFDGNTWEFFDTSNSEIPHNWIRAVEFERDLIWVATYGGGIATFDGSQWTTYNSQNTPLTNDMILDIAFDQEGGKWFALESKGFARFFNDQWEMYDTSNTPLPSPWIYCVEIDNNNNKWFGTSGKCFAQLTNKGEWKLYNYYNSGINLGRVWAMDIDKHGGIWMGSGINGITALYPGDVAIKNNPHTTAQNVFRISSPTQPIAKKWDITIPAWYRNNTKQFSVTVISVSGRRICEVLPFEQSGPDVSLITWNGQDSRGRLVANGIYFALIQSRTGKLISIDQVFKIVKM